MNDFPTSGATEVVDATERFGRPKPSQLGGDRIDRAIQVDSMRRVSVRQEFAGYGLWALTALLLSIDSVDGAVGLWSAWAVPLTAVAAVVTMCSWATRRLAGIATAELQRLDGIKRGVDILLG